jgi:hypothetical protein
MDRGGFVGWPFGLAEITREYVRRTCDAARSEVRALYQATDKTSTPCLKRRNLTVVAHNT